MAKPNPTDPYRHPTPPAPGKTLSVRVDDGTSDDLAILMRAHRDASDATRQALLILANAYYEAWRRGHYPPGVAPVIETVNIKPYQPVRHPDQAV